MASSIIQAWSASSVVRRAVCPKASSKSAARELARHGITVNAIAPGAATPMTETIRTDERFREKYLDRIPLGRWAEPDEIAPVFVFFASNASAYVTGQVLAADGGMTIR